MDAQIQVTKRAEFHELDLVLDQGFPASPVVVPDDGSAGFRLPHAWLDATTSLYDVLGDGLTLVITAGSGAPALEDAAHRRGAPLRVLDLRGRDLCDRYGHRLLLVRPDQYVAWAGDRPLRDPAGLLDRVLGIASH